MIERALHLMAAIDAFIKKEQRDQEAHYNQATKNGTKPYPKKGKKKPSIIDDALGKEGWQVLKEYIQILAPLKEVTKTLEGKAYNGKLTLIRV